MLNKRSERACAFPVYSKISALSRKASVPYDEMISTWIYRIYRVRNVQHQDTDTHFFRHCSSTMGMESRNKTRNSPEVEWYKVNASLNITEVQRGESESARPFWFWMHPQEIAVLSVLWEWKASGCLDSYSVFSWSSSLNTFWTITITIVVPFFLSDQKNVRAFPRGGGGGAFRTVYSHL